MVGVPRSKGCRICVQRRVRCDQARPTCNNCKKGNRPCPGYAQDLKFQDEGIRLRKRYEYNGSSTTGASFGNSYGPPESLPELDSGATADATTEFLTSPIVTGSGPHIAGPADRDWDVVGLDMSKSARRTFLGLLEGKSEAYLGLADTMPEVSQFKFLNLDGPRAANRYDSLLYQHLNNAEQNQNALITHFKEALFPDDQSVPAAYKNHARWLSHLPPLTGTNPLVDASVRAVTLVHIGRLNNSEALVMESRPYYGQALRLLNKALQDKRSGTSNETLCAVILLSFYEMFASDNNDSWIRHAGGVSALMRARGPAKHRHGFDREIFLAYRYTLIIEAFQEDVPCFLAEPAWLRMSQEIHSDLKNAGVAPTRLEIFDLAEEFYAAMVKLPEICAHARALWQAKQKGTPPPFSRADLIEKMTVARISFKSTFTRFEAALKSVGAAPTISLNHKDPIIGIEYEFANTFVAATYTGYWTVLVVLNLCLQGLQGDDMEMVRHYQQESKGCALNICRSCAYMLTSSFLGPFFLIFGLRTGLVLFEETSCEELAVEADWILRKLFDIGDRHMGIAKHVPGYRAGMTVDELIAEFRARSKNSKKSGDMNHMLDFNRRVVTGRGFGNKTSPNVDVSIEGPQEGVAEVRSSREMLQKNNWREMNQVEDVMQAWNEQDNFQLRQNMDNLNLSPHTTTARSRSGTRTPQQPTGMQEQQFNQSFPMPDMGFFNSMLGMDNIQLQDPQQISGNFVQADQVSDVQQSFSFANFEGTEAHPVADLTMPDFNPKQSTAGEPQQKNTIPRGLERFFS
ncbi:hypothetical protein LTR70_006186 [Exophiala xenobiotica]|uniref:Zn(2)-C6 fungal-type domain-containing protein n=1 Tax=Lithohypha guttulata TaxID=1690604 RepID=A0ABR0K851_9EURO|nr:hypothetical protein LTR24_005863 [Lithohypha guttulata]KAK5316637.1 hypothetical protein LTR70_006186 [Exophiala xenobiotica]